MKAHPRLVQISNRQDQISQATGQHKAKRVSPADSFDHYILVPYCQLPPGASTGKLTPQQTFSCRSPSNYSKSLWCSQVRKKFYYTLLLLCNLSHSNELRTRLFWSNLNNNDLFNAFSCYLSWSLPTHKLTFQKVMSHRISSFYCWGRFQLLEQVIGMKDG